jgi:hypothetical protein
MTTIRTAGQAYQAIAQLERKPKETVALLRKQLQPVPTAGEKIITQQLRDLSSDNFAVRSPHGPGRPQRPSPGIVDRACGHNSDICSLYW